MPLMLLSLALPIAGCSCSKTPSKNSEKGSSSEDSYGQPSDTSYADAYMEGLKKTSQADHLYYHYYRFEKDYNDWDVWAWPYRPTEGEGVKFDWVGRTTSTDGLSATGDATLDSFGYTCVDIDLKKQYDGGWDANSQTFGGQPTKMVSGEIDDQTQVGLQIVQSQARTSASGFWTNDGGNMYVTLNDYRLKNIDNSYSYHVFVVQDHVSSKNATTVPLQTGDIADPFANDDGTNVTYGNAAYSNVNWTNKEIKDTSDKFLKNAGVGYQIMVSSFADSDADGWGDIYGIEKKLDYLENLGIKVLWLTPIQSSDSYHGYDISDYTKVDSKYGSTASPAAQANGGKVTSETAMADYQSLLAKAHEKGMLVVMDLVLNHTSTTNTWFTSSAQLQQEYRGFYQWGNHKTQASQIKEANFWYPYGSHDYSYYAKFGSSMPELNYAYSNTRSAVEIMAKEWCKIGVDGFRMDAVKHIFLTDEVSVASTDTQVVDISPSGDYSSDLTKNLNFWRELNYEIKKDYPNAFFVGENFDGHAYHVAPYYEGFDSLFDFYSYFNLTSVASSSYRNGSTGSYTGWLASFLGAYDATAPESSKYSASNDPEKTEVKDGKTYKSGLKGGLSTVKYGGPWSIKGVMETNNKYRTNGSSPSNSTGYKAINGAFTSNHDIARAINRIAGNEWSQSGLEKQGNVDTSSYARLDKLAIVTELTELMLPGLTWIYYGDELGMTGNFPNTTYVNKDKQTVPFDANAPYADLWYRQPMKWKQGATAGDGSMTAGYGISGSDASVKWDSVNASSTVADAETQAKSQTSHYGIISKFAKAKNASQALIRGNYDAAAIEAGQATGQYGAVITRTLGDEVYKFAVNFGNSALSLSGVSGEVVASYNGATTSSLPAISAVLVKASGGSGGGGDTPITQGYGLKFGDGTKVQAVATGGTDTQGRTEYKITGYQFKQGDTFQLYDFSNDATWVIDIDPWSFQTASDATASAARVATYVTKGTSYTVVKDFTADVYIKLKNNDDQIYFDLK